MGNALGEIACFESAVPLENGGAKSACPGDRKLDKSHKRKRTGLGVKNAGLQPELAVSPSLNLAKK